MQTECPLLGPEKLGFHVVVLPSVHNSKPGGVTLPDNELDNESKTPQIEVQTQIGLLSDPVERTPVYSQTEITGSGRKFERTTLWTMVWRWSDQRSIWSEKSDHRRIRAHLGLIRADFERNWV